jgi:hypothetical protein
MFDETFSRFCVSAEFKRKRFFLKKEAKTFIWDFGCEDTQLP